jgi:RNA polymerase sigma factor (sigma-70 family)
MLKAAGQPQEDVAALVRASSVGDATAWEALVARFSGLVWSVVRGYQLPHADSADVFQTTWLRLVEHIDRLQAPDQVGAWLATTARRECLLVARTRGRSVPVDEPTLAWLGHSDERSPEQAVLEAEQTRLDAARAEQIWQALADLSPRCRQLLRVLMASPPPSYAEIAAALGMPVGSIGPTRARCLQRLRQKLAGQVSESSSRSHDHLQPGREGTGAGRD